MKRTHAKHCSDIPRERGEGDSRSHKKILPSTFVVGLMWRGLTSFILLCMFTVGAYAQVDAGSVQGQVVDTTGAIIPQAIVTLRNEDTGVTQSRPTDARGNYSFSPVRIGVYTVSAQMTGFNRQERQHLRVDIQQQLSVSFNLSVGSSQQSIEVTSGAPLLQTQNASVGQVVSAKQINNLPLNGRNYFFLAQLAPGVTFGQKDTRGENSNGRFSANGIRPTQNDYLLDGIDNNSSIISAQNGKDYVIQTPVDALSEFKIQTNNYNAEFGRAAGAVLNATVKSGSNDLHGNVWEFIRNDVFDANDYFLNQAGKARPGFRRNQFGGTLSGPIVVPHIYNGHGKTFFFGDYEGTRVAQGNTIVGTVPTLLERNSGFTNFSDLISLQSGNNPADASGKIYPKGTILDPATTQAFGSSYVRTPFSGNIIPASRIDPNAVKLLQLLPAPTSSALANNYVTAPTFVDNYNSFDIRIDQVIGAKDYLFVRYSYNGHQQMHPGIFTEYGNGYADGGNSSSLSNFTDRAQNVAIGETHTFGPKLINDLRIGVNREHILWLQPNGNTLGIPQQYGIQGVPQYPQNGGLPEFYVGSITSFGAFNYMPSDKNGTTPQINDDLTFIHNSHTIKIGYEQQRILYPFEQPPQSRGSFTFDGAFTSVYGQTDGTTGIAQMLLAPTTTSNLAGASTVSLSNFVEHSPIRNYLGAYVQDDWKATQKLTLNLGVRYDFYDFMHDRLGQLANFVPGPGRVGGKYLVTPQLATRVPASFITALSNEGIALQQTNGSLVDVQHLNFAPRVGFADQITNSIVLRGGYGLFYGGIEDIGGGPLLTENFPIEYAVTRTIANAATPITADNSIGLLENSFSNLPLAPATVNPSGLPLKGFQHNAQTPYSEGYNLSLEYQINSKLALSSAYVGSLARHIEVNLDPNSVTELLPPGTTTARYVPYNSTALSGNNLTLTAASSSYSSFQLNLEQRAAHGLTFLTNFAWQKTLTNARDPLEGDIGSYRAPFLPGFGIGRDLSRADFDVRRIFHFSGTYDLPYGTGRTFGSRANGIQQAILGGWSTNFIATAQDGQPFTVGCATSTSSGSGCNANLVPGVNPYAKSSVSHFVNAAAFSTPPAVTAVGQTNFASLGGSGTQVSGPPFRRIDLSLFKQFHFSERFYAEFRTEVFNITNTANFANPTSLNYANTTNFGQITSTRDSPNDPREIQFALKVYW